MSLLVYISKLIYRSSRSTIKKDMFGFLLCISGILFVLLVLLTGAKAPHSPVSLFELRRRQKIRDKTAEEALRREELLAQLSTLKAPLSALLLVALSGLLIYLLGLTSGLLASLFIGLIYARIAHLSPVRKLAAKLAKKSEKKLLALTAKHERKIRLIGGRAALRSKSAPLSSREELVHLLDTSPLFSEEDKRLLSSALGFKNRTVKEIMTPMKVVTTVAHTELLGPLVLHDLHKTGHTIFPVARGKEIVGLLDSSDHTMLRTKESVHVRDVMHTELTHIDQDTTLDEALKTFTATKQPLLIITGDTGEAVGIVSLGDTVRALTGWKRR